MPAPLAGEVIFFIAPFSFVSSFRCYSISASCALCWKRGACACSRVVLYLGNLSRELGAILPTRLWGNKQTNETRSWPSGCRRWPPACINDRSFSRSERQDQPRIRGPEPTRDVGTAANIFTTGAISNEQKGPWTHNSKGSRGFHFGISKENDPGSRRGPGVTPLPFQYFRIEELFVDTRYLSTARPCKELHPLSYADRWR